MCQVGSRAAIVRLPNRNKVIEKHPSDPLVAGLSLFRLDIAPQFL
jgi:hypothetical protein